MIFMPLSEGISYYFMSKYFNLVREQPSKAKMMKSFNHIKSQYSKECKFPCSYDTLGMAASDAFFQDVRWNTPGANGNVIDQIDKSYALWLERKTDPQFSENYPVFRDYLRHSRRPPAQFPPRIAVMVYKLFKAKTVLDPYAGWGNRALAAMAGDINYIGIDCNKQLTDSFDRMINFYPSKSNIQMFYQRCESVNLDNLKFDLIFSSPPFYHVKGNKGSIKLIESYPGTETDYNIFMKTSLIPLVKSGIKKKSPVCLHLPQLMYETLKSAVGPCNRKLKFSNSNKKTNTIYCWIPIINNKIRNESKSETENKQSDSKNEPEIFSIIRKIKTTNWPLPKSSNDADMEIVRKRAQELYNYILLHKLFITRTEIDSYICEAVYTFAITNNAECSQQKSGSQRYRNFGNFIHKDGYHKRPILARMFSQMWNAI
jgi:tRNA G10  N-methylase Trm11